MLGAWLEGKAPEPVGSNWVTPACEDGRSCRGEDDHVTFGKLDGAICIANGAQTHEGVFEQRHEIPCGGKLSA